MSPRRRGRPIGVWVASTSFDGRLRCHVCRQRIPTGVPIFIDQRLGTVMCGADGLQILRSIVDTTEGR